MKLTFEQIKSFTHGAVRFGWTDAGIRLYRFTEAQEKAYKNGRPEGMCAKM